MVIMIMRKLIKKYFGLSILLYQLFYLYVIYIYYLNQLFSFYSIFCKRKNICWSYEQRGSVWYWCSMPHK